MASRYERNEKVRRKDRKKKRNKFLSKLFSVLLVITIILLIWGKFGEVNILRANEYKISSTDIPESLDGTRIVQFSDIHYGLGFNEDRLERLINKINSYKPDVVLFSGDLIDDSYKASDKDISVIIKYLSKIDSTLGKYAVVGNHDFNNENYKNIMYDSDFTILKNNYDTIYYKDNTPILLYGVDNVTYGEPRMDILDSKDVDVIGFKMVLLHEPDYVDEFVNDYDIDLVFAGHSHNGQVKLPFVKPLFLPEGSKTYYDEYYKINDTSLYISSGAGSSIADFRLFTKASINVYRLDAQ